MSHRTRQLLRHTLVFVFLAVSLVLLTTFNATKPRILVLHALSQASPWTLAIEAGMQQVLASNRMPVSVQRDALNLDLLSDGVDTEVLVAALRRKVERLDPHVLIAVDDETSSMVARHFVSRPGVQIIYTGLMHPPERYGYTHTSGVWGIREQLPMQGITRLLEQVYPGRSLRIAAIGVDDLTGQAEMREVMLHDWGRHRLAAHALVQHFEDWKTFVLGPAADADVLLVLTADKMAAGPGTQRTTPELEVSRWTEQHAGPWPVGVRASYADLGGGLAVSSPPQELGAMAMSMALSHLASPAYRPPMPQQTTLAYDLTVRRSALARRGIVLPDIYLESARGGGRLYP